MKKSRVVEWTCDKCGKTVKGYSIFRPYGIGKLKVHIGIGILSYDLNKDLCSECAKGLTNVIDDYLWRQKQ